MSWVVHDIESPVLEADISNIGCLVPEPDIKYIKCM